MRVAARRLRAATSAFRPFLSPRLQRFRDELGWVGAALGAVRDLDVQLDRMAEWRGILGEQRGHSLDAVEALLAAQRQKARRRMLAVLDSRRYDRLVQRLSAALLRGPARSFGPGRQAILAVAPDLLERRYRRVRRGGAAIGPGAPPEAYHLLRIEAKKLRYALEFVGAIYERPAIEFSAKVTALQDLLGLHQDAYVAVQTLHDLATGSGRRLGPETLLAMGAIAERYERHAEELRKEFPATFRPLKGGEWARLRKLVEARRLASRAASPRRSRPSQPIPA
jgi:CHAD domain-containing protein